MKKKSTFLATASAVVVLVIVVWFWGYNKRKSSNNLPNLTSIAHMDEADVNKIVCGYRRDQLAEVWGVPDKSSSVEDVWIIEDNIPFTVNYHHNNDKAVVCGLSNQ